MSFEARQLVGQPNVFPQGIEVQSTMIHNEGKEWYLGTLNVQAFKRSNLNLNFLLCLGFHLRSLQSQCIIVTWMYRIYLDLLHFHKIRFHFTSKSNQHFHIEVFPIRNSKFSHLHALFLLFSWILLLSVQPSWMELVIFFVQALDEQSVHLQYYVGLL